MVDLGLKPSLARYEFREEHEFEPAVVSALDSDESLLVLIHQQSDVASAYLRNGDARKAISTLRRAHKLVEDRAAGAGGTAPVQRLASAEIRLHLCAVLSKLGRHTQALAEARAAQHETDEVWRSALGEPDAERAKPLQRLLTKPPRWLQNMVESSVQARQCVALELEFERPSAEGPALEEAKTMHREAVMLAQQLLPEEHPVLESAERAMLQAELRRQEAVERAEKVSATEAGPNSPPATAAELLLKAARKRDVYPAKLDATLGPGIAQRLLSALDGNMGQLSRRTGGLNEESAYLPAGDIYSRSLRRSPLAPEERGRNLSTCLTPSSHGRARSESQASLGKQKASIGPSVSAGAAREQRDPFKAWRSEVMDVNKMTMKEIKARTFEGIKDLAAEVKQQNVLFKNCWLRETDPDTLYENRTLHTTHGIRATERAERKFEAWKQKAWSSSSLSLQKKEAQRQLFTYYGVPMYGSEPDLKAWGKVLRESHARTPAERERRRREQEEKRRKEEEARRQLASEEQQALQQRYSSLKRPAVVLLGRA